MGSGRCVSCCQGVSGAPVLRPPVYCLVDLREERGDALRDELLEVERRLLVGEVEPQLLRHLEHVLLRLEVGDAGVDHQQQQVEDEVRRRAQDVERLAAKHAEPLVEARVGAAHRLDHLLAQLHRRREGLRVAAEDIAKVDVEERAVGAEHEVVEVPIAHAHQVHGDAVACARLYEPLEHRRRDAVRRGAVRVELREETADVAPLLLEDVRERRASRHSLHHPLGGRRREHAVRSQLQVKPLRAQQRVHQPQHRQHHLVLAQIVAALEDDCVRAAPAAVGGG
mmetsp:Transcript_38688/g.121462  ORF Transcript_38688/g.121462 Transcript_38688/m.121462 type:complete len:282 (+) Transcript_38688:866-1711(+)